MVNLTPRDSIVQFTSQLLRDANTTISSGRGDLRYLRQLDADMEHLSDVAFQLRHSRNACAPLLRLPQEILEKILLAVSESGWRPSSSNKIGWLVMTHICQTLRLIALHLQTLWAKAVFYLPYSQACMEILSRAGKVPLSITLRQTEERPSTGVVRLLKEHIDSARSIDIEESRAYDIEEMGLWPYRPSDLAGRSFPLLEAFRLKASQAHYHPNVTPGGRFLTPEAMIAPRLRSLCLDNSIIPFSPNTLTSLTISISYGSEHEADYIRATLDARLFDILQSCGRLEKLVLKHAIPVSFARFEGANIDISSLRRLHVTDEYDQVLVFLNVVHAPSNVVRDLVFGGNPTPDTTRFFGYADEIEKTFTKVSIEMRPYGIVFQFYADPALAKGNTEPLDPTSHNSPMLTVSFNRLDPDTVGLFVKQVHECMYGVGASYARTLHIITCLELSHEQWGHIFEFFSERVQTLIVDVAACPYLQHPASANQNAIADAICSRPGALPLLRRLKLAKLTVKHDFSLSRIEEMLRGCHGQGVDLERLRVDTVSFASQELGCAAQWVTERVAFLEGLAEFDTLVEGFVAEPDESTEDPEVRRAREQKERRRAELKKYVKAGVLNADLTLSMSERGIDVGDSLMMIV
ncbi:unnamed protein product [Peniophora sp. CBMAI 1063]|nr:unnamed protein product [Peniophora sp. CBMAI 1063]